MVTKGGVSRPSSQVWRIHGICTEYLYAVVMSYESLINAQQHSTPRLRHNGLLLSGALQLYTGAGWKATPSSVERAVFSSPAPHQQRVAGPAFHLCTVSQPAFRVHRPRSSDSFASCSSAGSANVVTQHLVPGFDPLCHGRGRPLFPFCWNRRASVHAAPSTCSTASRHPRSPVIWKRLGRWAPHTASCAGGKTCFGPELARWSPRVGDCKERSGVTWNDDKASEPHCGTHWLLAQSASSIRHCCVLKSAGRRAQRDVASLAACQKNKD